MRMRHIFCCMTVALAAAAAAYAKDMIDNPEYKYWSGCKAGSWVTLKTETDMGGSKTQAEMTNKLLEINADKAVVETTMTMMIAGKANQMPSSKRDIAAKIEKPDAKGASKTEKPQEGDEQVDVGGKKLKCHWVEAHTDNAGMKTTSKTWFNDEIPGHVARMETKMEGSMKGTTTVVATTWFMK